ncbi:hypothetical protein H0H87_011993 [Tephrocybe sp. NHM501043]|nr:hypothetical protein H0H87_011993 [Tephrocybe sp. NHM501043]
MISNNGKTKRKAPDDETNTMNGTTTMSNPLLNAAKKAKREAKPGASNKRKLANAEEQPGGLLIVRAPPSSAPSSNSTLGAKQPSKKFKSSQPSHSQPLPSTSRASSKSSFMPSSQPTTFTRHDTPDRDPALDDAVRAMDTEAADLRRSSRGPFQTPDASGSGINPRFRFPAQSQAHDSETGRGRRRETIVDMSAPLPAADDETPQIHRNKRLRAGAMAAIASGTGSNMVVDPITPPRTHMNGASGSGNSSHRRKSSVGRGKRISTSFQNTGVIPQPHASVTDTSFYKHIDSDLPDSDRVRQLLIWCSARAVSASSSSPSGTDPPPPPLPKLSKKAEQALKATQEDIVRKLAERRVNLSLFGGQEEEQSEGTLAPNTQNNTNRTWEGVYGGHIHGAMEEEEGWKKVNYVYEAYARRVATTIEKRRAAIAMVKNAPSGSSPPTPSAKAQGKQRAPSVEPREQELSSSSQSGMRLARKLIRSRRRDIDADTDPDTATPGAGPSTHKGADPDARFLPTSSQTYDVDMEAEAHAWAEEAKAAREAEARTRARMAEVEFKLDHLFVKASQARTTTEVVQLALDQRFEVLAEALDARSAGSSPPGGGGALGQYVGVGGAGGMRYEREEAEETLQLLRALAKVDAARPPAQVGDAARRAAREVQRVGESGGIGVLGERRLTGVPPGGVGVTPRKMPGTPRRGTTPK